MIISEQSYPFVEICRELFYRVLYNTLLRNTEKRRIHSIMRFECSFAFLSNLTSDCFQYPAWSHFLGWIFALSSIIFIPAVAVYQILIERGSLRTVRDSLENFRRMII